MHSVTKFLVVAAAVLSLLLAALVMAYSVNVREIRASHADQVARRVAAEASADEQSSGYAKDREEMNRNLLAIQSERNQIEAQLRSLQAEVAALRTDKLRAETDRDSVLQQSAQHGETAKTLAAIVDKYRDEVSELRSSELRYRQREIELLDHISNIESQNQTLQAQLRGLMEQVADLRRQIERGGSMGDEVAAGGSQAPANIRGRITDVRRDQRTGAILASVNLGSNNGLRENMRLRVVRGEQFLGNFIVESVDLQTAVGRIDTLGRQVEVRPDDQVRSSL